MLSACAYSAPSTDAPESQAAPAVDPIKSVAPELRVAASQLPTHDITPKELAEIRKTRDVTRPTPEDTPGVTFISIPGMNDAPPVPLLIFDPKPEENNKPVYLHMHGGGYIMGYSRFHADLLPVTAAACACVVVSVDYRISPETTFPGPMEDNLSALLWIRDNADSLGIDPNRIAIGGESAGGGHAAQLAIAARDRGIPLALQVLIYPMLDDRTGSTIPVEEPIGHYLWTAGSNVYGWTSYLGQPAGADRVPYGSVPARVDDLSGLAPAWIGVGDIDLFVAEDIEYGRRLEAAGVPVQMHITEGGFHGFDGIAANTEPAKVFTKSWHSALKQALSK